MTRLILAGILIILLASVSFAGDESSGDNLYLYNKLAQIKGLTPAPVSEAGLPGPKCGTSIALAVSATLRQSNNPLLANVLARPNLPDTLGGAHFLIHYTTTGPDSCYRPGVINPANGAPYYIDSVLQIFEYSWNIEIDTAHLGYNAPPIDSGRGGDNRYDVYIKNLPSPILGLTYQEGLVDNYHYYSYIELENDFAGTQYASNPISEVKVTAAHEFFHAIQFGYDAFEFHYTNINIDTTYKPWWLEATSTWMETQVYPEIPDYLGYLPYFYNYPWMGMGSFSYNYYDPRSLHPYACCIWPIYLSQKYGSNIIRQMWEGCATIAGYNLLPASDAIFNGLGSNFQDEFTEFAVWNFHTADRANLNTFYAQGNLYPRVLPTSSIGDLTSVPVSIGGPQDPPENLAANYIVIKAGDTPGGVLVNFIGQIIQDPKWYVALLGYRHGDSRWRKMDIFPDNGTGQGYWCNWSGYDSVVVIPTVSGLNPTYVSYSYSGDVSYDASLINCGVSAQGFKITSSYPSPFIIDGNASTKMTIQYSLGERFNESDIIISIFDVNGDLVRVMDRSERFLPSGIIRWDGKNEDGEYVAGGIYMLVMTADKNTYKAKIAVVNDSR